MRTWHHQPTFNTLLPSKTCSLGCALIHHHLTINTQHPSQTCSPRCALYIITEQSTPNTQTKHVPSDAHFTSSPNNHHPTPKPNLFPRMRTLHHHRTINTQHPDKTCSLGCALYIITEQSTPNTQTNMFPQMRTLHHHLTVNTQQP